MLYQFKVAAIAVSTTVLFYACTGNEPSRSEEKGKDTVPSYSYVKVKGTHFELKGKPYYFLGANFWQGMNLASKGEGGDRERLLRELDRMKALGITNLRVLGGSEGPDTEPYRIVPALQKKPGEFDEDLLDGLDFLLAEMRKRDMYAVMCMNDFWHWSGGMAQYIMWSGQADSIPYPPPHPNGDWGKFQDFAATFYSNTKAVGMYNDLLRKIIERKNKYNGTLYKDEPAIMAWQLGNEPRGGNNQEVFNEWIDKTAAYIKSLDRNHLVSVGSEGETSSPFAGNDVIKNHDGKDVDYATAHIWVQNWEWYNPMQPEKTFKTAKEKMQAYLKRHEELAVKLGKPIVVEEFGLARDKGSFDPASTTKYKDDYFKSIFEAVANASGTGSPLCGINFWAWAGEGRPAAPYGSMWKKGDAFIGDPPHEPQGWYSVYDTDTSTTRIISQYAQKMNSLNQ